MKRKLKLVKAPLKTEEPGLYRCPVVVFSLVDGEVVKRGCGRVGMTEFDGGLRCLYCGNYRYSRAPSVESMWFHFRWAREFWRTQNNLGRNFVNGFPVSGRGDCLPSSCLPDLSEARPPGWFLRFMQSGEEEFNDYMFHLKTG